jgi:hypothetical protein
MIPPELLGMPPLSATAPYVIFGDDIQVSSWSLSLVSRTRGPLTDFTILSFDV